ncbi:MAG: hypothetical protein JXD22_14055 [Sedimentisphaerales bacterium]|nr:hypothetical protein [Sedimentisphaerales bacterium]
MHKRTILVISLILCAGFLLNPPSLQASDAVLPEKMDTLKKLCFQIKVVDEQTGRGVPLIELKTTNLISYFTDSHGTIAFYEPGLMNREVFFFISGHGYEYPKDGFGFRGKRILLKPGNSATIKVKRINIAERLYRITGQGIYRDSVILGNPVPLNNPVINGLVTGQDSVQTCWYKDKLYWFWGDTARPSYPLGHFAMAGAVSSLPAQGGLDPAAGIDLHYFTDENGFSKKMAPLPEPGMIWVDGFFSVEDAAGEQHMLAIFARMKSLAEALERGIMQYKEDINQFVPIIRADPEFLLFNTAGHPFGINNGNNRYYYFATAFPLSTRMRIKASWESATNPNEFEVFTALSDPDQHADPPFESKLRWISAGKLLEIWKSKKSELIQALQKEKESNSFLYDIETGSAVMPHGGSIYWNPYRRKWIMITVQAGGTSSFLGEVWYAEADTPLGPWGYARKVVTHDCYSFYNPKHHPYLDQQEGRLIYFEGTYSHTFSGTPEKATPRYDYNQIMYRLDLSDERLHLPVPVYETNSPQQNPQYLLGKDVRLKGIDPEIVGVPFYAISPERAYDGLVPIYQTSSAAQGFQLKKTSTDNSLAPLFFGLPENATKQNNESIVAPLYEYTNTRTGTKRYSVKILSETDWLKGTAPLCQVWKNPSPSVLTDWKANPWKPWP